MNKYLTAGIFYVTLTGCTADQAQVFSQPQVIDPPAFMQSSDEKNLYEDSQDFLFKMLRLDEVIVKAVREMLVKRGLESHIVPGIVGMVLLPTSDVKLIPKINYDEDINAPRILFDEYADYHPKAVLQHQKYLALENYVREGLDPEREWTYDRFREEIQKRVESRYENDEDKPELGKRFSLSMTILERLRKEFNIQPPTTNRKFNAPSFLDLV